MLYCTNICLDLHLYFLNTLWIYITTLSPYFIENRHSEQSIGMGHPFVLDSTICEVWSEIITSRNDDQTSYISCNDVRFPMKSHPRNREFLDFLNVVLRTPSYV